MIIGKTLTTFPSDADLATEIRPEDLSAEQLAAIRKGLAEADPLDDLGDEESRFALDFDPDSLEVRPGEGVFVRVMPLAYARETSSK